MKMARRSRMCHENKVTSSRDRVTSLCQVVGRNRRSPVAAPRCADLFSCKTLHRCTSARDRSIELPVSFDPVRARRNVRLASCLRSGLEIPQRIPTEAAVMTLHENELESEFEMESHEASLESLHEGAHESEAFLGGLGNILGGLLG